MSGEGSAPTIFALSSGQGRAGVAVIRISGPAAGLVLDHMAGGRPRARFAALRRIKHPASGEVLDEALVLWFPAPKSETGEDLAELQTHGGVAVVRAVLAAIAAVPGCRLAEPGEFARRAFENGKIDLTQVEGLVDLIDAETEGQRRQALAQAGGVLARLYDGWREELIGALALLEAAIDFSDEADVAESCVTQGLDAARALRGRIAAHLVDGNRGEIMREGFQVVIAGAPNVGKSSLFNALLRREAAIVSTEAGTTRDVLEARLDIGGLPVMLSDTAGLRAAGGAIEAEGIRRAVGRMRGADLVLWVEAVDSPPPFGDAIGVEGRRSAIGEVGVPPLPSSPTRGEEVSRLAVQDLFEDDETASALINSISRLRILNKIDQLDLRGVPADGGPADVDVIGVSALTGEGFEELIAAIGAAARDRIGTGETVVLTQARHRVQLEACVAGLDQALGLDAPATRPELVAEDLRLAAQALGRITGRVDAETVLGAIFGRFCIGK